MPTLTPGIVAVIMVSGSVIYMAANRFHRLKQQNFHDQSPPAAAGSSKPKKKVRFSDSVVEPKGDNREFRRKRQQISESATRDAGNPPEIPEEPPSSPPPPPPPSISKKVEALLGSNLPANRIALYSDRYHDRLLKV